MVFMRRLVEGLKSPWSVFFSVAGLSYGAYNIIDMTQSGKRYELEGDLAGKTYIVTGATSGIGRATAEELAKKNARVIMACRNRTKCIEVRRDIVLSTKNKQVFCRQVDLADFNSIREFVAKIRDGKFALDRIDGVINNAATLESSKVITKSGLENTLATNFMGPFLLNALLLPKLLEQPHPSRIVFINTNLINKVNALDLNDLNNENTGKKKWDGFEAYKRTKLETAMFALELAERLQKSNVSVLMTDPGRTRTNLEAKRKHQQFFLSRWLVKAVGFLMGERRAEKATRPIMYAVADPEIEGKSKIFLNREREPQEWNELCNDKELRNKLWLIAEKWTDYRTYAKQLGLI